MKEIEVVAGIIYCENKILCVQRPNNKFPYLSKKYEFPGGKIELGETKENALARELFEELNIHANIKSLFLTVKHDYPDFKLTMHNFICEIESKEIVLNEHIHHKWLEIREMDTLDWAAADIPVVDKLLLNEKHIGKL